MVDAALADETRCDALIGGGFTGEVETSPQPQQHRCSLPGHEFLSLDRCVTCTWDFSDSFCRGLVGTYNKAVNNTNENIL